MASELSLANLKTVLKENNTDLTNTIKSEVLKLNNTVVRVTNENEQLWREVNKLNLVISGVPDSEYESREDLGVKIDTIIVKIVGESRKFDTITRVGKFLKNSARLIKVRFLSISDRDEVYDNRYNAERPTYINEDIPPTMRRDHAIMRQKKKQFIKDGFGLQQIKMDWNRRIIRAGEETYKVVDGNIKLLVPNITTTSNSPPQSQNQNTTHQNFQNRVGSGHPNGTNPYYGGSDSSPGNHTNAKLTINGSRGSGRGHGPRGGSNQVGHRIHASDPSPFPPKSPSLPFNPSATSSARPPHFLGQSSLSLGN
ncbi:hypothetical protein Fcan01_15225 [Folsomia candida]|uniref:Uncharacterized protein n=1 Tax=Folsomia candida TaxID=158441 RepID=A0A226E0D4_FOLCA|nr:hypothetical protein Fcan01_15225 [Folsomia candida]